MSEDSSERRQRESSPEEIWGYLVTIQRERGKLTEEQSRALNIRKTVLSVVTAIEQLMEDPTVQGDAVKEAELIAQYWQGMLTLQDLGIKKNMHVGDPPSSFNNPTKMAEHVAGQVIGIEEDEKFPNVRQTIMQTQEHSESTQGIGGTSVFLIPTKNIPPNLKKFIVLKGKVHLTHEFLASDLDKPQEPGTPEAS